VCEREIERERGRDAREGEERHRSNSGREEGRERKRASENLCITMAK